MIRLYHKMYLIKNVLIVLAGYSHKLHFVFDTYKSNKSANVNTVINYVTTTTEDVTTVINQGEILGESVNLARTYSQTPPNILTPDYFANQIEQHFKDSQVKVTFKNEDEIREEGIGLLDAVGKGSINPPRLVVLEYKGSTQDQLHL